MPVRSAIGCPGTGRETAFGSLSLHGFGGVERRSICRWHMEIPCSCHLITRPGLREDRVVDCVGSQNNEHAVTGLSCKPHASLTSYQDPRRTVPAPRKETAP